MKANNMTISVPTGPCDKCPYCISKMTPSVETNIENFWGNFDKAMAYADKAGVTTVLITGKGEPIDNIEQLQTVVNDLARLSFIVELQTKLVTNKDLKTIKDGDLYNVDVFAISVDNMNQLSKIYKLHTYYPNAVIRITFNVNDKLSGFLDNPLIMDKMFEDLKNNGVRQVTFRLLTIPNHRLNTYESDEVADYIKKYTTIDIFSRISLYVKPHRVIRTLNFGPVVFDVNGISVTVMDYCIQDKESGDNIRSLIYHSDGHMYTSWSSLASIIW